jgi:hypothetical protein
MALGQFVPISPPPPDIIDIIDIIDINDITLPGFFSEACEPEEGAAGHGDHRKYHAFPCEIRSH